MSAYPPPSETVPIFNSVYYTSAVPSATINSLSKYFLNFPVAQGTEYFTNASFSNAPVCSATQTYPSSATSNLSTIGYVNDAIASVSTPIPSSTILNVSTTIQLSQFFNFVLIGYPAGVNNTTNVILPYTGTAIPTGSLMTLRNNTLNPTSISISGSSNQKLYANSSNTSVSAIGLNAGASVSLMFLQVSIGTNNDGNWYVVGV